MHRKLKRIGDYQKTLPVLELYTAVQSEGSRQGTQQLLLELQDVPIDVFLEKEDGVILGIQVSTQKKVLIISKILLTCMMLILILRR